MIDIHAHILPGLDDGAADLEESIRMIRLAEEQGIHKIIATPHFSYHFPNASGKVRRTCEQLRQRLEETTDSQVELYCGQEILYCGDTLRQIREGEALSMAGSRYFLMEFLPFDSYAKIQGAVRSVSMLGKTVILAHVERYECLRKEGCVQELLQEGARLQMNYRPVGQKWYNETSRWCRKMLREENIHFLGTDMHNLGGRSPELLPALRWMRRHLRGTYREAVCRGNAEKIIKNEWIE